MKIKLYYLHQTVKRKLPLIILKIELIGIKNLDSSDWNIQKILAEIIQQLF